MDGINSTILQAFWYVLSSTVSYCFFLPFFFVLDNLQDKLRGQTKVLNAIRSVIGGGKSRRRRSTEGKFTTSSPDLLAFTQICKFLNE